MNLDDFDKQFDRDFRSVRHLAVGGFIVYSVLAVAALGAVCFVAYKVLAHFGIL